VAGSQEGVAGVRGSGRKSREWQKSGGVAGSQREWQKSGGVAGSQREWHVCM